MSRKKSNNEKILEMLKPLEKEITTSELAEKVNIDIRNITRYLKDLETKGHITRNIIQKGKIRVVNIKYDDTKYQEHLRALSKFGSTEPTKEKPIREVPKLPTKHIEDKAIRERIKRMNGYIPSSTKLRNMESDLGLMESRLKRSQTCQLLKKKLEILIPIFERLEKK